ncbi:MAG: AcrR family transcriptional regulator [Halioglobus sp.]
MFTFHADGSNVELMQSVQPNRTDPRIARSESSIQQALIEQLQAGQAFGSLTVSEVAAIAGVTRKTFYARFGSLEQLVERMVFEIFSEIATRIDNKMLVLPISDNTLSMMVFEAYEAHQDTLVPLIRYCPAGLFVEPVSTVLTDVLHQAIVVNNAPQFDEVDEAYLVSTMASVIHGVLVVWVKRGFVDSPERVARFVDTLLVEGIQRVLIRGGA